MPTRRYGAAACTHTGEMTIRSATARAIVLYLKLGYSLDDAVAAAVDDLAELDDGSSGTRGRSTPSTARGSTRSSISGRREPIFYWLWTPDMATPERRSAEIVEDGEKCYVRTGRNER